MTIVAMFSLAVGLVAPVFPDTARADYWSDYGSYYDSGYYDSGYASYDSYDYYTDTGYDSYYYDDYGSTGSYNYADSSGYYTDNTYGYDAYDPYTDYYYYSAYDPYADYNSAYTNAYSSYDYQSTGCGTSGCNTGCTSGCTTPVTYTRPTVTTRSATNVGESLATISCDVNPNGNTANVWFEWGTSSASFSLSTSTRSYSSATTAEQSLTGLSTDTTYYYRCVGENNGGKSTGSTLSFHTTSNQNTLPEVITKSATNIDGDSATLRCDLNPKNISTSTWFEYGTSSSMNQETSHALYNGSNSREVQQYVSNLNDNTTYYYRCVGENSAGRVHGSRLSFVTDNNYSSVEAPFVTTNQPTNVATGSATFNGYVDPRNDSNAERWFEYGTTMSFGYTTYKYRQGASAGSFNDVVSSLNNNTTYYYRAVAKNSAGTNYGNVVSFRTGDGGWTDNRGPVATTGAALNVARTSARMTGTASVSSAAYTTAWFEWGTSQSLGRSTPTQSIGSTTSLVNQSQFGLDFNTTYYYRLVAQNTYGISRGNIMSFTTLSAPVNDNPVVPVAKVKEYGARVTKSIENLDYANGSATDTFAEKGQKLRFTIRVENTGDYTLEETIIRDLIPFYLEFANADNQIKYDGTRREVVWYIGELRAGESREVTLDMVVTDDARLGMTIENVARLESVKHTEVSNSIFIHVTDNVEADARANRNTSGAAALFFGGDGFFPTTLFGWLILTILILIVVMLIRQIVGYYNEHKAKKAMKTATPAVPPAGQ